MARGAMTAKQRKYFGKGHGGRGKTHGEVSETHSKGHTTSKHGRVAAMKKRRSRKRVPTASPMAKELATQGPDSSDQVADEGIG